MNNSNLANATIGSVYNFDYKQPMGGDTRRHLAKVVEVKKLTQDDIRSLDARSKYRRFESEFVRTETIVTCMMPNGNYRNFYAERTENCRRSTLGWFLYWTGLARLLSA